MGYEINHSVQAELASELDVADFEMQLLPLMGTAKERPSADLYNGVDPRTGRTTTVLTRCPGSSIAWIAIAENDGPNSSAVWGTTDVTVAYASGERCTFFIPVRERGDPYAVPVVEFNRYDNTVLVGRVTGECTQGGMQWMARYLSGVNQELTMPTI